MAPFGVDKDGTIWCNAPMAQTDHPLIHVWRQMRGRCNNPNYKCYAHYGGRGIKVCERWASFWNFVADVGERPTPKHKLDRIDNERGYEPGNVRWVTQKEQLRNQRRNRMLTFQGRTQCLAAWAEELGMGRTVLQKRVVEFGWSVERALTTPVGYAARRPEVAA